MSYRGAPLFDRLTDEPAAPDEGGRDALVLSIAREIALLFNTRSPLPGDVPSDRFGTLGYGVPDLAGFQCGDDADRRRLETALAQAVATFEPRLLRPAVSVAPADAPRREAFMAEWSGRAAWLSVNAGLREAGAWTGPLPSPAEPGALIAEISGEVRLPDGRLEPVSFPVHAAARAS